MKKYLLQISLILIDSSCNHSQNNSDLGEKKIDSDSVINSNISETKKVKTHDLEFPKDYVITELGTAGDDMDYYFYKDNKLLIRVLYSDNDYRSGSWILKSDTIFLKLNVHFGKRGLGEQNIPEGMETVESSHEYGYDDYANFVEYIEQNEKINITDLKNKYQYRIDTLKFASDLIIDLNNFKLDGEYTEASMRLLDSVDLADLTTKQLRFMRNEIFARYDYIFKSQDLREYFGPKKWYMPKNENVDIYLTEIEKKNIELIKRLEK